MTKLTITEIAAESVELLPARETLLWDLNTALIAAHNTSMAVNAATVLSAANSVAVQGISVTQF
ncbi:hypothetical protein [Sinomonas sp. G460-2]|uniref:hypothetical protein n=1 Tax=Sinomonas sp. G460-2 TaxID=3393464 RepID=UPI0039F11073